MPRTLTSSNEGRATHAPVLKTPNRMEPVNASLPDFFASIVTTHPQPMTKLKRFSRLSRSPIIHMLQSMDDATIIQLNTFPFNPSHLFSGLFLNIIQI